MVDWDGFRVLLAVVSGGSFSAAARTLGISQPTAGRMVAALEEELGARLLMRRARGVALTPAGEEIIADVRRMSDGAAAAIRRARGEDMTVRISATERLGALWLPRHLLPLSRAMPGLRLELVVDNAVVDLSKRQADIAVRLFRPREPDLIARRVGTLGFALYASPAYLRARGTPKRVADLAKHDVIGFASGNAPSYVKWLYKIVPEERFVLRTMSLIAQQEAARAGFGIVIGTKRILDDDDELRRVLPRARVPGMEIWLAVHEDVRRNTAVARVYDALIDLFRGTRSTEPREGRLDGPLARGDDLLVGKRAGVAQIHPAAAAQERAQRRGRGEPVGRRGPRIRRVHQRAHRVEVGLARPLEVLTRRGRGRQADDQATVGVEGLEQPTHVLEQLRRVRRQGHSGAGRDLGSNRVGQRIARLEIAIDGSLRDPRLGSHGTHRRRFAALDQRDGGVDQRLARRLDMGLPQRLGHVLT
jgi:DNA-binding transcriptional LysR family regulator